MATLPDLPAPKNSGLALLADTANQEQGTYHYPVRRGGLPRALLPNWDAIRWLEADQAATEVEYQETSETDGLIFTFAYGRIGKSYPRPMFQVIHDEAFSAFRGAPGTACPCGDFSRTAYCDEHQELEYDWARRAWIRPGTAIWYEHHPEDRPGPPERMPDGQPTLYFDTGARPPGAGDLYDRMIERFGRPLPSSAEQEVFFRGRWITAEQLQNYGTSQCTCSICVAAFGVTRTPSGELNLGNPTPTPDAFRTSDRWVDRVLGLQDGTIRVEGVFGEGSFTFELEGDAGGDTRTT